MSAVQQMLMGAGGGAGAACDPYYPSVSLLLHMDGSNGSTTFTDNSPSPKTLTPSGNAQVNTSVVKYGTGSYAGDGNGDWLLTSNAAYAFGTGDFTIEFWVYLNTLSAAQKGIFGNSLVTPYLFISKNGLNGITTTVYNSGAPQNILTNAAISAGVWYHYAVVRASSVVNTFVNGIQQTNNPNAPDNTNYTAPTAWYIGNYGTTAADSFDGYIDDLRITKGVARYTSNFTPPTAAFPDNACALTPHLYWRVKNPDAGYYGTLELELRTVATGNTTISATNTGGTPISGGYYNRSGSDLNPGNAFNGTFAAPRFSSDAIVNGGDAWVGYQFPSAVIIREVALAGSGVSGQDFGGAVTVDWSDDGVSWTTAKVLSVSGLSSSAFVCYSVP